MKRIIPLIIAALITVCVVYAANNGEAIEAPEASEEISETDETEQKYTPEELEALAVIIYQEAGGDNIPDYVREYVGCVVLNRVESEKFPDTIEEVATQKRQWGRLYWTGIEWPERASLPGEAHAVERARKCAEKLLEMPIRPVSADVVYCAEFQQGEIWEYTNNIYFCKGE